MYLYAAYGSNLNRKQMLKRCPNSSPLTSIILDNYRLVFKGVADIELKYNYKAYLGIYIITDKCEKSLDDFEDFPHIYEKQYINRIINRKKVKIMFYNMNKKFNYAIPSQKYFDVIKEGYKDWNFDIKNLKNAGKHSLENNSLNGYKSKNWQDQNFISFKYLKFS